MRPVLLLAAVAAMWAPATAAAKPTICTEKGIAGVLAAADEDAGAGVGQIECGDATGDGSKDAVFTLLSGGTAGPIRVGVVASDAELVFLDDGYKITADLVNDKRFDVQQPVYKSDDANCCPSSYRFTPYRWTGSDFEAGRSKGYTKFKRRFTP